MIGFIIVALIASVLMILVILAQNPKGGIQNQLGASSNVLGVKKTTDFLEKSTWVLICVVMVASVAATKFQNNSLGNGNEEGDPNFKAAKQGQTIGKKITTSDTTAPAQIDSNSLNQK